MFLHEPNCGLSLSALVGLCYAAQVGRLFHGLIVRRPAFVRELFDKISFWIEWFKLMLDHPCSLRFPREYGHSQWAWLLHGSNHN
jgi:hypothetical protein